MANGWRAGRGESAPRQHLQRRRRRRGGNNKQGAPIPDGLAYAIRRYQTLIITYISCTSEPSVRAYAVYIYIYI